MKKRKFGFTVAEMVTAMSIVGIISAFVIPLSIKSFNKHQAGIVLGNAVEQIVLGNQNIIQLANMNATDNSYTDSLRRITIGNLYGSEDITEIWASLNTVIRPFWRLEESNNDPVSIKNFDGDNITDESPITDDGILKYNFSKLPASIAIVSSGEVRKNIYIDTNGFRSSPNTYGKDIFAFELNDDGTLRPFGADDNNDGLQFTERVVREGFRITYY